ncbi:MAG: Ig-like domain-containing protein [Syntrophomonadaceae bacterium]|nr:Ig-like domain-containing protein [Syntrophomonadaceae bacterium]
MRKIKTLYKIDWKVFTIDPIVNLSNNTTYTVTIPAGLLKDSAGNVFGEYTLPG